MKIARVIISVFSVLALVALPACSSATPTETPGLSDTDVAATVNAAVHATNTASAELSATVDAAVQATSVSAQGQASPAPTEVPPTAVPTAAIPTPVPVEPAPTQAPPPDVDTSTMSEEELATAIDEAVAEAMASYEEAAATTSDATTDGTVTVEETVTVEVAWADVEEAIVLAEYLITLYAEIYGDMYVDYATEALALLIEMEDDLEELIEVTLLVLEILAEGSESATVAIEQINAALEMADINYDELQALAEGWLELLQVELENRSVEALAVQATEIAADRQEAIQSAFQYVETVRVALGDSLVSQGELAAIALAGANATASLKAQGGVALQNLSGSIDTLTSQIATGQWPQAQMSLGALEAALPSLP